MSEGEKKTYPTFSEYVKRLERIMSLPPQDDAANLKRLVHVVERISLGKMWPRMKVEVTKQVTHDAERPAILISIDTVDSVHQENNTRICECVPVPEVLTTKGYERELVRWIHERCQDELLHELDEFFCYRGETVAKAVHPVTAETFAGARARQFRP